MDFIVNNSAERDRFVRSQSKSKSSKQHKKTLTCLPRISMANFTKIIDLMTMSFKLFSLFLEFSLKQLFTLTIEFVLTHGTCCGLPRVSIDAISITVSLYGTDRKEDPFAYESQAIIIQKREYNLFARRDPTPRRTARAIYGRLFTFRDVGRESDRPFKHKISITGIVVVLRLYGCL
ncbi:hypothetical protein OUZ56_000748 [Daphnia magna]|uniref:Uncharacterized protein n=1 Tax=Daphnia magna TaxID=35525 RepID=A0ABR0A0M2_9CRUS|nr:hypothetical protein OUZ56_000748 [Daphnia magna]